MGRTFFKQSNPWGTRRHIRILIYLFLPAFFAFYIPAMDAKGTEGDAAYYLAGAYNLVHHGTFSGERGGSDPKPDAYRTPAYSWFLSLGMRILPPVKGADTSWFTDRTQKLLPNEYVWLKYMQLPLLLAVAIMTGWLVLDVTGRKGYAHTAVWIMAFHPFLQRYVKRFYTELFGSFLISLFSFVFYFALKKRSLLLFLASGVLLGSVTLTFPQWKYVMPCCFLAVFIYGLLEKEGRKKILGGALLLLIGYQCLVYPWQIRNEEMLGRNYISGRGGSILLLRAYYDKMPWDAYASSFLYWTYGLPKYVLKKFVDREHYYYLDSNDPNGAIGKTRVEKSQIQKQLGVRSHELDSHLMKISIRRILDNPVRHLLVSIPLGYRSLQDPTFSVFNLVVYAFFLYSVVHYMRSRKWMMLCLFVPVLVIVGFNALVTHGLPRYTWPLTPLVWVGALAGVSLWREK